MKETIYMDHAATTATDPRVVRAMEPFFVDRFGNPSTMYSLGTGPAEAVEQARSSVARLLAAKPEEIFFTSGGTESNNWAVKGTAYANESRGNHIITTKIEHHAVLEPCRFLEKHGFDVTYLDVDEHGLVDPDDVRKAIGPATTLVSVMHANNEIGTIEPVEEIGRICRQRRVAFHVDAVQTVGKIPVDVERIGCDMLSVSAHKFYGPKGVGVMYLRKGTRIEPVMHGGGQERKKRAGTHNTPGIVGMGKAAQLRLEEMEVESERLRGLALRLRRGIFDRIDRVRLNGHPDRRLAGNVNVCVDGAEGEAMLLALGFEGICVSSGSACTTGDLEPSHVLLALGIPPALAHGSLRFTLGRENTEAQVDAVLDVLPRIVERFRTMSPIEKRT